MEESHEYLVDGYFVLSTSSILHLNGFTDYSGIPPAVLAHAAWRGKQTHMAIQYAEEAVMRGETIIHAAGEVWRQLEGPLEEIKPFFKGYLKFRQEYDFEPIGELERDLVYLHDETAVGATIDFRGKLHGKGFQGKAMIGDCKTNVKQYGMAQKQKLLAFRMQTQSYKEASHLDEEWLREASPDSIGRFIVNPDKEGNYSFYDFSNIDDEMAWDSSVRLAALKLSNGHKLKERN